MFQAARYLSMHAVTQVDSVPDKDEPGVVTHFSKQFAFTFSISNRAFAEFDSIWTCLMKASLILADSEADTVPDVFIDADDEAAMSENSETGTGVEASSALDDPNQPMMSVICYSVVVYRCVWRDFRKKRL